MRLKHITFQGELLPIPRKATTQAHKKRVAKPPPPHGKAICLVCTHRLVHEVFDFILASLQQIKIEKRGIIRTCNVEKMKDKIGSISNGNSW